MPVRVLPKHPITWPASVARYGNGALPASVLASWRPWAGAAIITLAVPAMRSLRALLDAAADAGFRLGATSAADSYRSYTQQRAAFLARYSPDPIQGASRRLWNGRYWYLRTGAPLAAPGTSNHGWAIAVDFGQQRDADAAVEPISDTAVVWLIANAGRFGWSAELDIEPWHWRHHSGDTILPAVLMQEAQMALTDEDVTRIATASARSVIEAKFAGPALGLPPTPLRDWIKLVLGELREVRSSVDQLPDPGMPGNIDVAALSAAIAEQIVSSDAFLDAIAARVGNVIHARMQS